MHPKSVYRPQQAHQLVAPVTAIVLNVVSLLEQINKASGTWHTTRDITFFFFSDPTRNENRTLAFM